MPVIKSAIKKLRKDKKREKENDNFRKQLKDAIKKATKSKKGEAAVLAISLIDKAAKKNIIHKNKAARTKSQLMKLVKIPSKAAKTVKTPVKKKQATKTSKTKKKV